MTATQIRSHERPRARMLPGIDIMANADNAHGLQEASYMSSCIIL